jgi:hypothetical protein
MFFGLLFGSCKDKSLASLPGIYVNESASRYTKAFDTLTIAKEGNGGNIYSVARSVSFNRIKHGKLQSKEYHLNHWVAVYDERTNLLTDTKKGRSIAYIRGKKKLYLGNTAYLKLGK